MQCRECGCGFQPTKFNPRQQYCSADCRATGRRRYKQRYDRAWRRRNPGYMKRYLKAYRALG